MNQQLQINVEGMEEVNAKLDILLSVKPDRYAPDWLTVDQYAEKVGKTPATVARWCRQGRLRVVRDARPWRILQD